ncbi:hypothetical protein [Streptomyces mirabilis]|uniref:hypothetical protein n=1 Tax=Streptomyces mirabilis TaxID=68239 RepID=UPI00340389D1
MTESERFARLVLLIPPTVWEPRSAQANAYRGLADLAESGGPEAVTTALAASPVAASLSDAPGHPLRALGVRRDLLPSVPCGTAGSDLPPRDQLARLPHLALVRLLSSMPCAYTVKGPSPTSS